MNNEIVNVSKLDIQEQEYQSPVHWQLRRADGLRYRRLSKLLVNHILRIPRVRMVGEVVIMDLGCGDGLGTTQVWGGLRERGVRPEVHGSDYSVRAIGWAQQLTSNQADHSLSFEVAKSEVPKKVATGSRPVVVLMREVIEHLTEEQISSTLEVLKITFPNAYLIVTTPSVNSPTEPKHYRHYTLDMLKTCFERNALQVVGVSGFGFRPRVFCSALSRLKYWMNRTPFWWRLSAPLWSQVPPGLAMTLVATASWDVGSIRCEKTHS